MQRRVLTNRREMAVAQAENKLRSPTDQRLRIVSDPSKRDVERMRPRQDRTEKRHTVLDQRCNKKRPENNTSKGGGSRSFAGKWCKK